MKQIKNERLSVEIAEVGAELYSIKGLKSGTQYLWQGDAAYWDRRSPTLFPQVGGLWEGTYRIDGQPHKMEKHGFVRNMPFEDTTKAGGTLCLSCSDTEETRAVYPFAFRLDSTFRLCENRLIVEWEVHNPAQRSLPFHIGGHPGFFYPGFDAKEPLCGYLGFDHPAPESAAVGRGGCLGQERYLLPLENGLLPLTDACFHNDAIILDRGQVHRVTLYDKTKKPVVSVETGAPVILIWSPYGIQAPFVCIEPWYGLCDSEDYKGSYSSRPYTNIAPEQGSWKGFYSITFENE